jgi:hypothetical protein
MIFEFSRIPLTCLAENIGWNQLQRLRRHPQFSILENHILDKKKPTKTIVSS